MPKKSRQAHIPSTARKRRSRRASTASFPTATEPGEAVDQTHVEEAAGAAPEREESRPAQARVRPRADSISRRRSAASGRSLAGQLPLYEPGYLGHELRQIGLISASLLAVILLLAVLLR